MGKHSKRGEYNFSFPPKHWAAMVDPENYWQQTTNKTSQLFTNFINTAINNATASSLPNYNITNKTSEGFLEKINKGLEKIKSASKAIQEPIVAGTPIGAPPGPDAATAGIPYNANAEK